MVKLLRDFLRRAKLGYKRYMSKQGIQVLGPQVSLQGLAPITIPIKIERVEEEKKEGKEEKEIKPVEKPKILEGIEIPEFLPEKVEIGEIPLTEEERRKITLAYPLIPRKPGKDELVFAYAKIFWDSSLNKYVYQVVEPELTEKMKEIISKLKELIQEKLDIEFGKLKKFELKNYLFKTIDDLLNYYKMEVSEREKLVLRYYIERDFIGLGRIEPLMADENIEDISCDGVGIPIFVFHRNPKLGSIVTNIVFNEADELDSFIHRLAQLCGKSISVATPLVGGSLPDGSRVQAALATDIARRGSNFTIRKFTVEPLTPIHLLKYNTIDIPSLAFLWLAVDFGRSVLVAGGTASGKTTLLNVLSLFIRPEKRIVSIEDTPELKLPHPHWVPYVARTAIGTEERKLRGEIDLFDLLKDSLRQRPDYIVVGEVRGREAYVLFQEMATGHPSLATIHAENINKLIDRLTTPPISLPASLVGSLDLVVFLLRVRYREKHVRKVNQIVEIVGIDPETKEPVTNEVFRWDAMKDKIVAVNKSITLKKIAEFMGLTEQQVKEEMERRMVVLNWMMEKNITRYKDVFNVFNMYYTSPEKVLASIMGGR
ncbi:MAG: type II/IV secretion system ATPase subunit [Candidatus Aenigmatarchaeota archaeon]